MRQWRVWVGIAISLIAVAWAVRGVDWSAFRASLASADYALLAVLFVLAPLVNISLRALRWRILLSPVAAPSLAGCISATAIGLMANNVLPARIGEFVRAYALGRRERMPIGTAFGALFVERLFDGFALVALLYALTWIEPFPDWVFTTVRIGFYVFAGFLAFQILLAARPQAFLRFARRISRRVMKGRFEEAVERALGTFVDGFRLLRRPWLVVASFALALAQWSAIVVTLWIGLVAFGLAEQVGWTGAFFANSVTAFGVAVPSSPGFVGTFQAFMVESLSVFGVERSAALGFSVGIHVVSWVSLTAIGLAYFLREGLSWRELEASEERVELEIEASLDTEMREPDQP